jgi:hypothetical protein
MAGLFRQRRDFSRTNLFGGTSMESFRSLPNSATPVQANPTQATQYNQFLMHDRVAQFENWALNGIKLQGDSAGRASLQLAPVFDHALTCTSESIDGGAARYDASVGLCAGSDPMVAGGYENGRNYYNGGGFYFGTLTSPVIETAREITTIISSWDALTPAGTWLQAHVRTLQNGIWTRWYNLPIWASGISTVQRHSVEGQHDDGGRVDTDTYYTGENHATAYQLSYTLFTIDPKISLIIKRISAVASFEVTEASQFPVIDPDKSAWGINLPVPQRSQNLAEYDNLGYGGGGGVWCSPTSISMVMAYWSKLLDRPELTHTVPETARDIYDYTYDGTGNWPFNTAYTGEQGMHSFVTRLYSLSQVEQWIKCKVPLIISLAWKRDQLPGADAAQTNGHLVVVRGFTAEGDVISNDPASPTNERVQHIYPRAIFEELWLQSSKGTVYINYPEGWSTPVEKALGCW